MKFLNKKVNDCIQHIILQKSTNFYAISSWSLRNICNEIGWPVAPFFAPPYILIQFQPSRIGVSMPSFKGCILRRTRTSRLCFNETRWLFRRTILNRAAGDNHYDAVLVKFDDDTQHNSVAASSIWNSLPADIQLCESVSTFKRHLKIHLLSHVSTTRVDGPS